MPLREKLRKVMSRSDASSSTSDSHKSGSTSSTSRKNSLFYQPGEVIPYKYRRPVAKEHKAKLDSFSFASSWRRKSHQSQYSPMGSRAVSRRNSVASQLRRGFAKRAQGSIGSIEPKERPITTRPTEQAPPNEIANKDFAASGRPMDSPQHDTPFSQEELARALQRSTLEVPAQG